MAVPNRVQGYVRAEADVKRFFVSNQIYLYVNSLFCRDLH